MGYLINVAMKHVSIRTVPSNLNVRTGAVQHSINLSEKATNESNHVRMSEGAMQTFQK
jgi:hypothetical protein